MGTDPHVAKGPGHRRLVRIAPLVAMLGILALLIVGAVVPWERTGFRRCTNCGRYEDTRDTWWSSSRVCRMPPMGPLEAWIARNEGPCRHTWQSFETGRRWLIEAEGDMINPGVCNAYLIDSTMQTRKMSDEEIAGLLRESRAGRSILEKLTPR